MLSFSPALKTQLDGTATQVAYANAIKTTLGATPRVRCWRAATANAADPVATGTEFLNFSSSGITVKGYKITSLGKGSNVTISNAADLTTGTSVLRIEGGGQWVQGTIGLAGSGADFIFTASPSASTGVALTAGLAPPTAIPSGTGYAAPALDADTPSYVVVEDWTGDTYKGDLGRINFNNRIKNWVFEDTEYAANVGDVRVTQSTDMVTFVDMEIGAQLLSMDPQVGTVTGKVRHQVMIDYKPTAANWANYPANTGIRMSTTPRTYANGSTASYILNNTFPKAHKIRICRADDTTIVIMDMPRDHLPVNSDSLSEVPTITKPQRLKMHCASMMVWDSHDSKMNSFSKKYMPGMDSNVFRPSQGKQRTQSNPIYSPMIYNQQINGMNHWYAMPPWSYPANQAAIDAELADRKVKDPYLFLNTDVGLRTPAWANFWNIPAGEYGTPSTGMDLLVGTNYEPGNMGGHDMYCGPGGMRFDRAVMSTPHAIHLTDPTWKHMRQDRPIGDMVKEWNKCYFNHAVHHVTDVKTFASIPVAEVLAGKWAHYLVYYNGQVFATDSAHSIPQYVFPLNFTSNEGVPHQGGPTLADGRQIWNGYGIDWYHNYSTPGTVALYYNSPAHAVSTKFRYLASIMAQFSRADPSKMWGNYLVRDMGWCFMQHAYMWKLGSDHPLGIKRADIEARIEAELMAYYKEMYIPIYVNNSQTMEHQTIRNLGLKTGRMDPSGQTNDWGPASFTLHYYMAHALQIWRQFGLWKVMMDKSPACKAVLLMLVKHLDLACIDYYLDTDGCYSGGTYGVGTNLWVGSRYNDTVNNTVQCATSWADWLARVNPKGGPLEDLVHTSTGALRGPIDIGEWQRMQWTFIRRDYFSDIPSNRDVAAACNKVTGWMNAWKDYMDGRIASGATPSQLSSGANGDLAVVPAYGRILPPATLEP